MSSHGDHYVKLKWLKKKPFYLHGDFKRGLKAWFGGLGLGVMVEGGGGLGGGGDG